MLQQRSPIPFVSLLLWAVGIVVAGMFDARVATFVRQSGLEQYFQTHVTFREVWKFPGTYLFTLAVILLAALHERRWLASLLVLFGTLLSGTNEIIKFIVGRRRPFKIFDESGVAQLAPFDLTPFVGGKNLSFPSGHAALEFATAAALSILWPRWRFGFYFLATVFAAERVLENAHWLSDVVSAVALGIGSVWCIRRFWWDKIEQDRSDSAADGPNQSLPLPGDPGLQRAGEHSHAPEPGRSSTAADSKAV